MMQRRPIAVTTQPRKKPIWSFYTRLYQIYIYIYTYMYVTFHHKNISILMTSFVFFSRFFSWRRSVVTTSVHCTLLTKTNDRRTNSNEDSGLGANHLTAGEEPTTGDKRKVKKRFAASERTFFWILGKKRKWVVELQINVFLCSPPKITDGSNLTRIFCRMGWNHQVAKFEKEEQKFPPPRHTILCST